MSTITTDSSSSMPTPFLGQPIEICIVTPDLRSTLAGLVKLGIGPFKIFHFSPETVTDQTIREKPVPFEIEVAFAEQGSMIWEVMQPISGPSIMQEFLDGSKDRKGGIHHVAFDCAESSSTKPSSTSLIGAVAREEAQRRRRAFEERGFPLVMSGLWHGKSGTCEFMFFDTEGAVNCCFETYVFSGDWEEPVDVEIFPAESAEA